MNSTTLPTASYLLGDPPSAFPATLRAEWTKFRTVRATPMTILIAVGAALALSLLNCLSDVRAWDEMTAAERFEYDAASSSLIGVLFGALVLSALGVRTVTAEYSTGMIRTTLAAIPNRRHVVVAKLTVVGAATAVVALAANLIGFAVGQAILDRERIGIPISDRDSVVAIVLGALAVSTFAALGVGIAVIVRRASLANVLIALIVIGGQIVGSAIPSRSQRFLPFNALQATVTINRTPDLLAPATALGYLFAYAAVAVAAACIVISRRDV